MADIARIGPGDDPRETLCDFFGQLEAGEPHPRAQEAVNHFREVGKLVNQQNVDFRALVLESVLVLMAMAQVDFRAIPEPDFPLHNLAELVIAPG